MEKLSKVLKKLRENKGYTLEELSKKAGVGRGTIGDIETGKSNSTIKTLNKLATALELTAQEKDELFTSFLGRKVNNSKDERIENLNKRERLQYEDFINDSVLYFQDEGVSFKDKEKFFNSLQDAFFEIKLANKRKK